MAASSKFFKDQLCKQNVQVPVILRLEDFGLELKRDAVSYIIEFVYRGEVRVRLKKQCCNEYSDSDSDSNLILRIPNIRIRIRDFL